jgi:hypothetical protein
LYLSSEAGIRYVCGDFCGFGDSLVRSNSASFKNFIAATGDEVSYYFFVISGLALGDCSKGMAGLSLMFYPTSTAPYCDWDASLPAC